jgi:hypothetical protein
LTGECKHISSSTTELLLKNQLCNILDDDKSCRRLAAASPPPLLTGPLSTVFLAPRSRNQTVFSGRRIARVTWHIVYKSQLKFRKCKIYQSFISRNMDTQRELFFKNYKLLGLGSQIGLKFYEAFGVFLAKL